MAQSGYTPISLYYSSTASAVPTAGNLVAGELAINTADGKLYYKDSGGTVQVIAGTGGSGVVAGSNTQIQFNNNGVFGASSSLTWNGSTLAVTGALTTTGNTTLGDASTDTVTVNGYMGVGGAGATSSLVNLASTALVGAGQRGIRGALTFNSQATTSGYVFSSSPATEAASFTMNSMAAFFAFDATKGAGSTITNLYGLYISDQTQGTNNYGITSAVSSGTNKWNIYASGTASNYFAGNVLFGASGTPTTSITISKSAASAWMNATNGTVDNYFGVSNSASAGNVGTITNHPLTLSTNNTERLRIESGGNVGIGLSGTAADGRLHVQNGSAGAVTANGNADELVVESSVTGGISILTPDASTGYIIFGSPTDNEGAIIRYNQSGALMTIGTELAGGQMVLRTGSGSERVRIDSSGNVGIGLGGSSPSYPLQLQFSSASAYSSSDMSAAGITAYMYNASVTDSTATTLYMGVNGTSTDATAAISTIYTSAGNAALAFGTRGGGNVIERLRITSAGDVGIGTTSPAYRLDVAGGDIRVANSSASSYMRVYGNNATAHVSAGTSGGAVLLLQNTNAGANVYSQINAVDASASTIGQITFVSVSDATNESYMAFATRPSGGNLTERLRIDSSGSVGIGVTPGTWTSTIKALQIGPTSVFRAGDSAYTQATFVASNARQSSATDYYIANGYATSYGQQAGAHFWNIAGSGTAGNTISFTQAMTLDASGRLLVGNTSNNGAFSGNLQVEGTSQAFVSFVRYSTNAAGAPGLYLARSKGATVGTNTIVASGDTIGNLIFSGANGTGYSDAASISAFVDGTPGASADMPGRLVFSTSADGSATPTERARITSDGYLRMASGSLGIQFNGDTAAANALDDYEEGTFTPTYVGSSGGSFTADIASGYYTKVGNLVSWQLVLRGNRNTLSGNIGIQGFPFSAGGETGAGAFIAFCRNFATDMPNLRMYMQGGSGGLSLRKQATNATASTNVTSADMGTGVSDNYLYLSGQYLV